MKNIVLFKDKGMKDIFDDDDNVKNVMTPKGFSGKKYGLPDKAAFLYKGFPMYLDRTVIHVRKEDIPKAQEFMKESVELNESVHYKVYDRHETGYTKDRMTGKDNEFSHEDDARYYANHREEKTGYAHEIHKIKNGKVVEKTSQTKLRKWVKESIEQIDEISSKKMETYITKAKEDGMNEFKKGNSEKFKKRLDGIKLAAKKSTLKRYDNALKSVKESEERISKPIGKGFHIVKKSNLDTYDGPFKTHEEAKKVFKDEKLDSNRHEIVNHDGKGNLIHYKLKESVEQIDEISVKTLQSYRDKGQGTEEDIKKRHKSLDLALNKIRKANLKDKFTKSYDKKDEPKVAASKPSKTPKSKPKPLRIWDDINYNKKSTLLERINKFIKR